MNRVLRLSWLAIAVLATGCFGYSRRLRPDPHGQSLYFVADLDSTAKLVEQAFVSLGARQIRRMATDSGIIIVSDTLHRAKSQPDGYPVILIAQVTPGLTIASRARVRGYEVFRVCGWREEPDCVLSRSVTRSMSAAWAVLDDATTLLRSAGGAEVETMMRFQRP